MLGGLDVGAAHHAERRGVLGDVLGGTLGEVAFDLLAHRQRSVLEDSAIVRVSARRSTSCRLRSSRPVMSSNTNIRSRTAMASAGSVRSSSPSTTFSVSRATLLSSWASGLTPPATASARCSTGTDTAQEGELDLGDDFGVARVHLRVARGHVGAQLGRQSLDHLRGGADRQVGEHERDHLRVLGEQVGHDLVGAATAEELERHLDEAAMICSRIASASAP